MKKESTIWYATAIVAVILSAASCSQKQGQNENDNHDHSEATEANSEENSHEHNAAEKGHHQATSSDPKVWIPSGTGPELLQSDFHYITGGTENISPEVLQVTNETSVLQLTTDGTPTAFVFHSTYGNIGMAVLLNVKDFNGTVQLIHHVQNTSNYEFVAIHKSKMKLGRVVEGIETIFDEDDFGNTDDWINLRVSAAGTHFKGYIGGKNITHGHGDKMKDGYAGIMIEGIGKVLIKSIEVSPLEDE